MDGLGGCRQKRLGWVDSAVKARRGADGWLSGRAVSYCKYLYYVKISKD